MKIEIKRFADADDIWDVSQKLPDVKIWPMNQKQFCRAVVDGLDRGIMAMVIVRVDQQEESPLVGCAVTEVVARKDEKFLWVIFFWVDPKAADMADTVSAECEKIARESGLDTMRAEFKRGFRAIQKYGWQEEHRVFAKKVEVSDERTIET